MYQVSSISTPNHYWANAQVVLGARMHRYTKRYMVSSGGMISIPEIKGIVFTQTFPLIITESYV